jgi:membrane fusion protein (multidrug efflux system)
MAMTAWRTVSTDDAYVNGHVTFVAPRVAGQVVRVLVDDNNRVRKGELVVQLDPEPFQVRVNIARAAVEAARANLVVARARTRGVIGEARSMRFGLEHAIEAVDDQLALLRSKVAALRSQEASVEKAQADYDRGTRLITSGGPRPPQGSDYDRAEPCRGGAPRRLPDSRRARTSVAARGRR